MTTRKAHVGDFVSPASFWTPEYLALSAWLEHAPFAFWLVDALRPRSFVELGTEMGFSYLSFCQAVAKLEIPATGFAVDHWEGDEQTSFYGEEVFEELAAYHDPLYSAFSALVRSPFDDAVADFDDDSIDLLHLDGLHTYEAVRHDFETWRPKLSSRAVVLFHDTNVRDRDFGVYRLWAELRAQHPGFEFVHGHGLGVLGVGTEVPPAVMRLLQIERGSPLDDEVREAYETLGESVRLRNELEASGESIAGLRNELDVSSESIAGLRNELGVSGDSIAGLRNELEAAAERVADLEKTLTRSRAEVAAREQDAVRHAEQAAELDQRLASIFRSRSWRLTAPYRFGGRMLRRLANSEPNRAENGSPRPERIPGLRRLAVAAKPYVPAPVRSRLRATVPGAVDALMGQAPPIAHPRSVDELVAERLPPLRPLSVFPDPTGSRPRITLVTDSLSAGSLYGGVGTSMILGALLAQRFDARLRIVTRSDKPVPSAFATVLQAHGIDWEENVEFLFSSWQPGGAAIPTHSRDVFLTTSWLTTWSALRAVAPSQIVYLLQEDERIFYPASDEQLICHDVLADDRINFVVNTSLLFDHLVQDGFSNLRRKGIAFEPAFPRNIYYPTPRSAQDGKTFFFYARPNNLRNHFLLGVSALRAALASGVLDPSTWNFWFVGKDVPEVLLPHGVVPRRAENLAWPDYARLIRHVDVGLSLIRSPHPSYPPLDLAACGAVAVTNRFGLKQDLDRYSANIICAELTVDSLTAAISRAVSLAADTRQRETNCEAEGLLRSWSTSFAPVLDRLSQTL